MQANFFRISLRLKYMVAAAAVLFAISCRKTRENSLEKAFIYIIEPAPKLVTSQQNITFSWETILKATKYRIQIASPDFDPIEQMFLDTSTTQTFVVMDLPPGLYEWRIRPENATGFGDWTVQSIEITPPADLSAEKVQLSTPDPNLITNVLSHAFRWFEVTDAEQYKFIIKTPDRNGTDVIPETNVGGLSHSAVTLGEGYFEWGVKVQNSASSSNYSWRSITIDNTVPLVPILNSPMDGASIGAGQIEFDWTRPNDPGSIHTDLSDSLFIYNDSLLTDLRSVFTTREELVTETFAPGTFWWLVGTYDAAGNASGYATQHKLIIF